MKDNDKKQPDAQSVPSPGPAEAPAPDPVGLYEVACDSIVIRPMIYYRTHRLRLQKSQADNINSLQPGSLTFVGI